MAKELIEILTRAAEVRDETGAAENTASKGRTQFCQIVPQK